MKKGGDDNYTGQGIDSNNNNSILKKETKYFKMQPRRFLSPTVENKASHMLDLGIPKKMETPVISKFEYHHSNTIEPKSQPRS